MKDQSEKKVFVQVAGCWVQLTTFEPTNEGGPWTTILGITITGAFVTFLMLL